MKSDSPQKLNPRDRACPICHREDYKWGTPLVGKNPPGDRVFFRPDGSTWEDGDIPLVARNCLICGNIQFFTVDS